MKKFRLCCAALALVVALTSMPLTAHGTEDTDPVQKENMTQQETAETEDTLQEDDVLQEEPALEENAGSDAVPGESGNEADENVAEDPGENEMPAVPAAPQVTVKLNTAEHIRYMNGSSNGMFYPSSALTRAEAAQMIYSLLQDASPADVVVQDISFRDVKSDAWYAEAVNKLASYGVISGSGGAFRPEALISRAEFLTILSKFSEPVESDLTFSDVSETHWAYETIASAAEKGWISGYSDGTFHPDSTLLRSEAAAVTNRVLGRSPDKNTINSASGIRIFPDLEKWHWAYYDIMEASIGHEHSGSGSGEVWTSFTKEKTALSEGTHVINGILYRVKPGGIFAANEYIDGHWYDTSGKICYGKCRAGRADAGGHPGLRDTGNDTASDASGHIQLYGK